ncbi:NRDE family protein [Cyclobacterium sp. SYSU L10401]|uniref:NRDE family protein n=1 Tax=Cyclobacterium sp. SYSU L10401 TaxID=2678657 RepID=UPI0013D057B9|nr:NRDE family protein [Cyclobacterium sp. SYSU L10401]
MCLITFSWRQHPDYKLVLTANRDEYFQRPTQSLHHWENGIYAGRDLKEGGTWLGFHPDGRFAALTNFRDIPNERPRERSRGELVTGFLNGTESPQSYLRQIEESKEHYNGFNLLVGAGEDLYVLSNYGGGIQAVKPGIHAISNAYMDTPWPKVQLAKEQLKSLLASKTPNLDDLLGLLQSRESAPEKELPATGLSGELEKAVSAQFIRVDDYYGTVNTTAVLWHQEGKAKIKEVRTIPHQEITEFNIPGK